MAMKSHVRGSAVAVWLVVGGLLLATPPARGAETEKADEDPWVGKSRAEVVKTLGEPNKVKKPGRDGESLTYKFSRFDPDSPVPFAANVIAVPGVGIVAGPVKVQTADRTPVTIEPTTFDEQGRPEGGGISTPSQSAGTSYNPMTGKHERSGPETRCG